MDKGLLQALLTKMNDDMAVTLSTGITLIDQRSTHGVFEIQGQTTKYAKMVYNSDDNTFNIEFVKPVKTVQQLVDCRKEVELLSKSIEEASELL